MECPICKNTMGFSCGTCIECGYNYLDHRFHFIEVDVDVLRALLPEHVVEQLVDIHSEYKRR